MDNMRIGTLAMQVNLWASLGYGLMLLLVPDVFCDLLKAEAVNTAWLRTIGAALIGTNVVGSWLWLKSPGVDMGKVQFAEHVGHEQQHETVAQRSPQVHLHGERAEAGWQRKDVL